MSKRYDRIPVRHGDDESAELFPGRDKDVSFDRSDPVNDQAWEGAGEKYVPQYPSQDRDGSGNPEGVRGIERAGYVLPGSARAARRSTP
jgi:hypothetical protein